MDPRRSGGRIRSESGALRKGRGEGQGSGCRCSSVTHQCTTACHRKAVDQGLLSLMPNFMPPIPDQRESGQSIGQDWELSVISLHVPVPFRVAFYVGTGIAECLNRNTDRIHQPFHVHHCTMRRAIRHRSGHSRGNSEMPHHYRKETTVQVCLFTFEHIVSPGSTSELTKVK